MAAHRREPVRRAHGLHKFHDLRGGHLTLVLLVGGDLLGSMLNLQKQLNTLNGSYGGLGDGSGDTTGDEVLGEGERIGFLGHLGVSSGKGERQESDVHVRRRRARKGRDECWLLGSS